MASREWVRFNDDSRAKSNREKHVSAFGGEFVKSKKGWEWNGTKPAPVALNKFVKKTIETTTHKKKKFKGDSK